MEIRPNHAGETRIFIVHFRCTYNKPCTNRNECGYTRVALPHVLVLKCFWKNPKRSIKRGRRSYFKRYPTAVEFQRTVSAVASNKVLCAAVRGVDPQVTIRFYHIKITTFRAQKKIPSELLILTEKKSTKVSLKVSGHNLRLIVH